MPQRTGKILKDRRIYALIQDQLVNLKGYYVVFQSGRDRMVGG